MSTVPLGFVATLIVHKSIISVKKVRLCNEATNFNQTLTFFPITIISLTKTPLKLCNLIILT